MFFTNIVYQTGINPAAGSIRGWRYKTTQIKASRNFVVFDMSPDILLVFSILIVSAAFLITGWIPMEVTGLLVLGAVALTGLLPPVEALSGFSNPAVVTIWAVFILSGGLAHTGVASVIGRIVHRIAGSHEMTMIVVIMATAGPLSAIVNNIAVVALMLPVVMDIARNTGIAPSRLLIPLAYGSLLGSTTTLIGKPSNLLVTEALRESGLEPFSFFDFTPVGLIMMLIGILFMALAGRHLLPERNIAAQHPKSNKSADWQSTYGIEKRLFHVRVPSGSSLSGKTLAAIRLGAMLGWNVICITRHGKSIMPPGPEEALQSGDLLTVEGRAENMEGLKRLLKMNFEKTGYGLQDSYLADIRFCEAIVAEGSPLAGSTLEAMQFDTASNAKVLAIRINSRVHRTNLRNMVLSGGEFLLLAGKKEQLEKMEASREITGFRYLDPAEAAYTYGIHDELMLIEVPEHSDLTGKTIAENLVGETFLESRVLGIIREGKTILLPGPSDVLLGGDKIITAMASGFLRLLTGIENLQVYEKTGPSDMMSLLSSDIGFVEAILAPGATIEGKTLRQLNFREKYGLIALALWRRGSAYRSNLKDMKLAFGDAILLFGPVKKLQLLGSEPNFIVLSRLAQEKPRTEKMPISILIMAAILFCVVTGWVPIYIAAVTGAAMMIATGCLSMEEAYRHIEWKAVFLIAGLLPLGAAMEQTGAAMMAAQGVASLAGSLGPGAMLLGLILLTMTATCVIPIPAVVVLMTPVALNTAAAMGISPYSLMMATSMAASASFITPLSHPTKLMVMGPGGYGFKDYMKTGLPLTLLILAVLMLAIPFFWPLAP
ncbi:MAG: SLC13 family permease [Desulfosalsimonadaceae bacterium]